eukprot:03347.XXX_72817_72960_1 [CDS] Oithona nana genome sequencing.
MAFRISLKWANSSDNKVAFRRVLSSLVTKVLIRPFNSSFSKMIPLII